MRPKSSGSSHSRLAPAHSGVAGKAGLALQVYEYSPRPTSPSRTSSIWNRAQGLLSVVTDVLSMRRLGFNVTQADELRYLGNISVWLRWMLIGICVALLLYRPAFDFVSYAEYSSILVLVSALNGFVHFRILANRKLTHQLILLLSVMDVMMPEKDGIEACREIREALPDTRVLILTASTDEDAVLAAVAAGATGYLQKLSGKERLLSTIQEVAAGEFSIPGDLTRRVFDRIRSATPGDGKPRHDGLTEREREILTLFAQGLSYAEIAEIRGNRPLTIRNAIYVIRDKIGAKSIQEMVVWAVRHGLLNGDPAQSARP